MQQHLVLVVEDLVRHAAEKPERQLVGIHCGGGVERAGAEIHKLVTRAAQHQHEEIHLLTPVPVGTLHPVLPEDRLPVFTEGKLGKLLAGARRLVITLGDAVLQPQVGNEVKHRLAADLIQTVTIPLLQTVLYLAAGETGELTEQINYERLIAVKLVTVLTLADTARQKLLLAQAKIMTNSTTVDS